MESGAVMINWIRDLHTESESKLLLTPPLSKQILNRPQNINDFAQMTPHAAAAIAGREYQATESSLVRF